MAPAHRLTRIALALLVIATACVRLVGIDFLLPQWREPDAQLVQHLRYQRQGQADEDSGFRNAYPYVLPYLLHVVPDSAPERKPETLAEHVAAVSRIYVETRSFIALLSVLVVPLTFLLARRFVSEPWALFAAALAATSVLAQWFSQEARPHAAATAGFLLGVVAAVRLRHSPTWREYLLAGAAAAIALGSLHSGFAVLLAGLAAHLLRDGPRVARDHVKLLAPVVLAAVGVLAFYPFFFPWFGVDDSAKLETSGEEFRFGRHTVALDEFTFGGTKVIARTLVYYDPVLTVLAALALVLLVVRFARESSSMKRDFAVVLAHAGPYALMLAAFDETYERFVLPLIPYLAVLAAWGASRFSIGAKPAMKRVVTALALAALALQSFGCLRLAWLRREPDTMELATQYVSEHGDPEHDKLIVSASLDLPLARNEESLFSQGKRKISFSRWAKYQSHRPDDPLPPPHWDQRFIAASRELGFPTADSIAEDPETFVRKLGPGIYVFNAGAIHGHAAEMRVYDVLKEHGQFLARFAPHDGPRWGGASLEFQDPLNPDFPPVFPRILSARSIGPVVEIFRVPAF